METRFACLIWDNAPTPSGELVKLCDEAFGWKKSTTYTMLRRLCDRGIFRNADGVVSVLLAQEELQAFQIEQFVQETFDGSLPKFLTAFVGRAKLSEGEIDTLQRLINKQKI